MKVLYSYLNRKIGKDVDDDEEPVPVKLPDGRMAHVAKRFRAETAEELARQLSAALSGELDYHDLVINSKLAQVQAKRDEREQFQKSMMARASVFQTAGSVGGGARILGGKAEADAYVARMKALEWEQFQKASREHRPDKQNSDDREK